MIGGQVGEYVVCKESRNKDSMVELGSSGAYSGKELRGSMKLRGE